jgi:hypothetical protein
MSEAETASYPRALNAHEATLLSWCADRLPQSDCVALKEQIANCQVVDEDNGGLWFRISPKTLEVRSAGIDLIYADLDGAHAQFLIAFVAGYLEWVDRYRSADGGVVLNVVPQPAEIEEWRIRTD